MSNCEIPPKWGLSCQNPWRLESDWREMNITLHKKYWDDTLGSHNWRGSTHINHWIQPPVYARIVRYHYSVRVDMVSQDDGKIAHNLQFTEWTVDDSVVQCPLLINPVICSKCCRPLTACYGDFAAMISQIKTQHYMSKNVDLVLEMFINTDTNLVGYLFSRWKLRTTIV